MAVRDYFFENSHLFDISPTTTSRHELSDEERCSIFRKLAFTVSDDDIDNNTVTPSYPYEQQSQYQLQRAQPLCMDHCMDDAEDNTEVDQNDCYQEQGLEPALSSCRPDFITHNNNHILNDHYTYQHCH